MVGEHVTVLDGGMGRELLRIGAPFRQPEWSALALVEGPDWVVQAHTNFIEAGADVITTNSYALVPFHIGAEAFAAAGQVLAALSGELARRAADGSGREVRVAGSLPPLFGSYRPDLFDAADAPRIIDPLIAGLAEHVDIWLGETLSSIAEARAIHSALDRAGETKPLWISYTLAESTEPLLRCGESVADAVRVAVELGASAILFNCCQTETIGPALAIARSIAGDGLELGGYANRFVAAHDSGGGANEQLSGYRDDISPEVYAEFVGQWLECGATILGGCCGMGPDHVAAIAALVHAD
jgi:S-methylmethionine-dependent homocysteine/selenocysteine methylase